MIKKSFFLINAFIISLLLLTTNLRVTNAQETKSIVDSILINNEKIDITDGCNLVLKYNDVIRLAGRSNKGAEKVVLSFADKEYSTISDYNREWMILISIPNIENGKYKIMNNDTVICEVELNTEQDKQESDSQNSSNKKLAIYILIPIFLLPLIIYIFLVISKKNR
mgnify:CR=1 FL=1